MSMVKCKICNADVNANDKFCAECGAVIANQTAPQPSPTQEPPQPSQPPQEQPLQATQPVQHQPPQAPQPAQQYQHREPQPYSGAASAEAASISRNKKTKDNTQLGVFGYVITMLALMVPILGLILVFVWAFGSKTNLARKKYCRAVLVVAGIFLVLGITGLIMNYNALMQFISVMGR